MLLFPFDHNALFVKHHNRRKACSQMSVPKQSQRRLLPFRAWPVLSPLLGITTLSLSAGNRRSVSVWQPPPKKKQQQKNKQKKQKQQQQKTNNNNKTTTTTTKLKTNLVHCFNILLFLYWECTLCTFGLFFFFSSSSSVFTKV